MSLRDGGPALFVMNADGSGTPHRITPMDLGMMQFPVWSPDGGLIAVNIQLGGDTEIWVMGSNGSFPRRISAEGEYAAVPNWTQDGRLIYSSDSMSGDITRVDIFVMDIDGSNVKRLTHTELRNVGPAWKPGPPKP